MSTFIKVTESRNGDQLLVNIDSIVVIHEASGTVHTNTVHGEGNGIFRFGKSDIQKIMEAVKLYGNML